MNKIFILLLLLLCVSDAFSGTWKLLGDFTNDWRRQWHERKFTVSPTQYTVVEEDGIRVLKAHSKNSASGLWRKLKIHPVESGSISWIWRAQAGIATNPNERTKKADDYPARIFVVFEPRFFTWKTRSICYVWSSQQAVGSMYPSPYAKNVATFVVESGNRRAGKWITERRDVVADYKQFFGEPPTRISAVALMTDTDNTGVEATAYFNDIVLSVP